MQNFADQCLDLAQAILGQNLGSINEDGSITPVEGEGSRLDEPGHAALAIGEFYRATGKTRLDNFDLVDLAARAITQQAFTEETFENGLAYSALGLLSFGPSKNRNAVWERLLEQTRERLDRRLLARTDYDDHLQAFNIAKSVTRFSLGLSKKDETGRLIDRFIERIESRSTGGYFDDANDERGMPGAFDVYGIMSFVFTRQALQLHANVSLRERKLPSLRTHSERYLKLLPDIVRSDGLGWSYGEAIGAYGQMHCISLLMQALRDGWIADDQKGQYVEIMRRLFFFFFVTYLDQEQGFVVVRDAERTAIARHTTRMSNFDAARYLCQWSRLAKATGEIAAVSTPAAPKKVGRFIIFDKSNRKEQGLFIYRDPASGMHVQIPLVAAKGRGMSDSLAFPHSPGIFDWPADAYLPIGVPELKFGDKLVVPCFYGKRCTTLLDQRTKALTFKYDQPELITKDEEMLSGLGSAKVTWSFAGTSLSVEYAFSVKNQVSCERIRYVLAIGAPHSFYRMPSTFALGAESLRANVLKDDFQCAWADIEDVSDDPTYRTNWGNINYLQTLIRDHPLVMRPGQQYRLVVQFEPDLTTAGG